MNPTEKMQKCKKWYQENKGLYEVCGETVERLIATLLQEKGILYHSIGYRVKAEESFLKKCRNEKYHGPITQITDMCGLRIIGYTNHDVKQIRALIEEEFQIDAPNSVDKFAQMKDDQVGYLSIHYIATLKEDRARLVEYKRYKNLKFEIQIRTMLQHAWAEIEHDRNYKFGGELPSEIKRRFYLVAGTLEMLDREFERLSDEIDHYAYEVRRETERGNLDEPINSTSLVEYLSIKLKGIEVKGEPFNGKDKEIILELQAFGIRTLKDLDAIITDQTRAMKSWRQTNFNYLGALRDIMIAHDPQKYFENVYSMLIHMNLKQVKWNLFLIFF